MKVLDLFSGIGGASLGLEAAGMKTVSFCEIDPYCRKVLAKHWPKVPIHDDIKTFNPPRADIVCGGYPCQGESLAGKRTGKEDIRWLWPEMRRIVRYSEAGYVICENVYGHISGQFDEVCSQLESDNFTVWPFDIFSCAVGLPTVERHIWIIAAANDERRERIGKEKIPHKPNLQTEFPRSDQGDYQRWNLPESRVCGVGFAQKKVFRVTFCAEG